MADISKINVNGIDYDIKDITARSQIQSYIDSVMEVFVQADEPVSAKDGDIWFDLSSELVPNGDNISY